MIAVAIYTAIGIALAVIALRAGVYWIDRAALELAPEPVREIDLVHPRTHQRSHVVTEGQGQGVGVQHHEKER